MKVAIMMMYYNGEPSLRNKEAFSKYVYEDYLDLKHTNQLENEYKFFFYYGGNVLETNLIPEKEDYYRIEAKSADDIHATYEKTIDAFNVLNLDMFDYVVRINISLYLNIRLLDKIVKTLDPSMIYCNALNAIPGSPEYFSNMYPIYPRGDFYIISSSTLQKVLEVSDKFYINRKDTADYKKLSELNVDHVDDVLFGCSIMTALGPTYFRNLKMLYYNLLMETVQEDEDISKKLNKHILAVRLKTTPPGQVSGYSWNDNEYRLNDVVKFKKCYEFFSKFKYENGITVNHLLVDENNCRPVTILEYKNVSVKSLKDYLEQIIKKGSK